MQLTEFHRAEDAYARYSRDRLWALFDGDRDSLNITHECLDRHAGAATGHAVTVIRPDEAPERLGFRELADYSARFASWLGTRGIGKGDRVAIMLEPSLAFYASVFGAMRAGAVAVPLFTLFGPDGLRLRIDDCKPALLLADEPRMKVARAVAGDRAVLADASFMATIETCSAQHAPQTHSNDVALLQYTSGTTRELPEAVVHTHRAVVSVAPAALYGLGLRRGDRYCCPSSPAWGHGMWHGTVSPLALGVGTVSYAGRFDARVLLDALAALEIDNLAAASTHYRMLRAAIESAPGEPLADPARYCLAKASFTGEPMDSATGAFVQRFFGTPACSMYGTTETGVILVNFPGAPDFEVRPGSLGKPMPGVELAVHDSDGNPCEPGELGQIVLRRRGSWVPTRDLGRVDEAGYFHHAGRADDVIISAGWTMSATEIEDVLLRDPAVLECAAIGVPDELRGQIVRAYVVPGANVTGDAALAERLQRTVRERLSQHEYPRQVEFVASLPRTPAGKVNRRALREQASRRDTDSVHPSSSE